MCISLSSFRSVFGRRFGFAGGCVLGWSLLTGGPFGGVPISQALAQEQKEEPLVGIRGILSEEIPTELDTEFLADNLPETWKSWAEGLDREMQTFHFDDLDIKAQRKIIAKLRERVAAMERAIPDPRYAPIRDRLISLAGPLKRRLDLADAVLDALQGEIKPASMETRNQTLERLRETAQRLNSMLTKTSGGGEWKTYFELPQLIEQLEGAEAFSDALQKRLEMITRQFDDTEKLTADQHCVLRSNLFWEFRRAAVQMQTLLEWDQKPVTKDTLRDVLAELAGSLQAAEENNLIEDVLHMELALAKLRLFQAETGPMFQFMKANFYADNIRANASESLMQEIVYDRRTQANQINETILGAQVYGNSVSNTETTFDLLPSPDEALMAVRVKGDIDANTVGVSGCIKVYAQGDSQFWAVKATYFNGFRFQPYPAEVAVRVNTIPYDAETTISCFPLLGSCLDKVILSQAISRKAEGEAIGRQKIADRVVPELNRELNKSLGDANTQLSDNFYKRLSDKDLYPAQMHTATTETELSARSLIRNPSELGGGPAPVSLNEPTGTTFHVHESLLNNLAHRMNLAGRTMTEAEVRVEMGNFLTELTGQIVDLTAKPEPMPKETPDEAAEKFVFDKTTPLRFQIRNNQVRLTLRTGLIRANGDKIPPHDVTVPLEYEVTPEEILIKKGTLMVSRSDGEAGNFFENGVMRKKIGDSIPEGHRSRLLTFRLQEGKELNLRVEKIKALDGWMDVWALSAPKPENGSEANKQPSINK